MPQTSRGEKAKLQVKKMKKVRANDKLKEEKKIMDMSEEEQKIYKDKRTGFSLSHKISSILWDFEHNQFSASKTSATILLLEERIAQIKNEGRIFNNKEYEKIEAMLDVIREW